MKKLEHIREIFKNTKHKKPVKIYCPRCASPNINLTSSLSIGITPRQYLCQQCGYIGTVIMELEEEKET
jgi:transposase-like protein